MAPPKSTSSPASTLASPDNLILGGGGGAGENDTLDIPAHKTFAIRFRAQNN